MDTVITRSRWVLGFFIFALSICAVRLVQLQIIEGPSLAAQGQRVRTSSTEVAAARGTITDATGVVLANSIQTYDIAVNQVNIRAYVHRDDDGNEVGRGPAEAARQLAPAPRHERGRAGRHDAGRFDLRVHQAKRRCGDLP